MEENIIMFLEGRLPFDKEDDLYEFLESSPENLEKYRQVEEEWKKGHPMTSPQMSLLERFHKEIDCKRKRSSSFWKIAAVAAVIVAVCFTGARSLFSPDVKGNESIVVETPNGSNTKISLPDGTLVWLNAGSSLRYSSVFNKSDRDVDLQGEAYFEVVPNNELPFRVMARGCTFTVKGTRFDIQAYEGNKMVEAALLEGSLQFETISAKGMLSPDEMVSCDVTTGKALKDAVNADQYKSWIDGVLTYDKITLPVLCTKLSKEFNRTVILETDEFNSRSFRVAFQSGETIETILEALETILPIKIECTDGVFYISERR